MFIASDKVAHVYSKSAVLWAPPLAPMLTSCYKIGRIYCLTKTPVGQF